MGPARLSGKLKRKTRGLECSSSTTSHWMSLDQFLHQQNGSNTTSSTQDHGGCSDDRTRGMEKHHRSRPK